VTLLLGSRFYTLLFVQALAAAKVIILTTRRTVDEGSMMCAGTLVPMSMGPTVTPLLLVILSTFNKILAASKLGQIKILAEPLSVVLGK
jgi:hypothetical protein